MFTPDRLQKILRLAFPITVGMASSFIMVFVDLAMVGSLGAEALAAIGLAGFSYTFVTAFVLGVAPAVQGMVARATGQKDLDKRKLCLPLNAGLCLVVLIAIPLSLLCYLVTPSYFSLVSSDENVMVQGIPYLQALFTAVIAIGMTEAFEGFWAGIGKTKVYMVIIALMSGLNILLNYLLIFGKLGFPAMGTLGAGIASAISVYAGAIIYFVITRKRYREHGFLRVFPTIDLVKKVFAIGLPENFREALFSLGYIVFYWLVGQIGTVELAATNVLIRVSLVLTIFPLALGITASTLVSKALGKGNTQDAVRWGWETGVVGVIWVTALGLPLVLFPEWFLSLFLNDSEAVTMAVLPLQMTGALTGVTSLVFIFAYTLISLGDGKRVLLVSFGTQWVLFLPAVWLIGPYLNYGLFEIWLVQTSYALIATALIVLLWCDGKWKKIEV